MEEAEPLLQQLVSENFTAILVLAGVIIAQIGVSISHKIRGGVEEKAESRERRVAAIARWRAAVDAMEGWGIKNDFQDSSTYSEMKPFLRESVRQEVEKTRNTLTVSPRPGVGFNGESEKQKLLDEITRIEREEWKLL